MWSGLEGCISASAITSIILSVTVNSHRTL